MSDQDMFTDESFAHFDGLAHIAMQGLNDALSIIEAGAAPRNESISALNNSLMELRELYEKAKAIAAQSSSNGDSSEDLPMREYKEAIGQIRQRRARERVAPVMSMLRTFCSVTSESPVFEEAFVPCRDKAIAALRELESLPADKMPTLEELESSYSAEQTFIRVLGCDDLGSKAGLALLDQLEGVYPIRVSQGLLLGRYRLSVQGEEAESGQVVDAISPGLTNIALSVSEDESKNSTARDGAVIAESVENCSSKRPVGEKICETTKAQKWVDGQTPALTMETATPKNSTVISDQRRQTVASRPRIKVSASSFKRLLLDAANPQVPLVFASVARFGCVTSGQVKTLSKHAGGKRSKTEVLGAATGTALNYLAKRGVLEAADGVCAEREAFVLTSEGALLASKESVKTLRDNRGRLVWPFPLEDVHGMALGRDGLPISASKLLDENECLISFLETACKCFKKPLRSVLSGCAWQGEHWKITLDEEADGPLEGLLVRLLAEAPADAAIVVVLETPTNQELMNRAETRVFLACEGSIEELVSQSKATCPVPEDGQVGMWSKALPTQGEAQFGQTVENSCKSDGAAVQPNRVEARQLETSRDEDVAMAGSEQTMSVRNASWKSVADADIAVPKSPVPLGTNRISFAGDELTDSSGNVPFAGKDFRVYVRHILDGDVPFNDSVAVEVAFHMLGEVDLSIGKNADFSGVEMALALLKGVNGQKDYSSASLLYRQLSLAVDSPLEPCTYTGAAIQSAFPVYDQRNVGFALATYCLAMAFPQHGYDYVLHEACKSYRTRFDEVFTPFPAVKPLFQELCDVWDVLPNGGFSAEILAAFSSDAERAVILDNVKNKAIKLCKVPSFKAQMSGLPSFSQKCFGKGSALGDCMEAISRDEIDKVPIVRSALENFIRDNKVDLDEVAVDKLIDDTWRNVSSAKGMRCPRKLALLARNQAREFVKERLDVMATWLAFVGARIDEKQLLKMRQIRDGILDTIAEILSGGSLVKGGAGTVVLRVALEEIVRRLRCGDKHFLTFHSFLATGIVPIGSDGLPAIESKFSRIAYCEPWRAVLTHYMADKPNLDEAAERIRDDCSPSFDNLGQLAALTRVLGEESVLAPDDEARERARLAAEVDFRGFNDQLEIAFAYNRINEVQKETLATYARDNKESFFYRLEEYGCYRSFLDGLLCQVDDASRSQVDHLEQRIDAIRQTLGAEPSALLDEASRMLHEDKNLTVAEEYLNRFDAGERSLPEAHALAVPGRDDFDDFVSDSTYGPLFKACRDSKGQPLASFAKGFLKKRYPEEWTDRQRTNSESLVSNWPVSRKRAARGYRENLAVLMRGLGFRVKKSERARPQGREIYHVAVRPVDRNREAYDHPIAAFGTQMKEVIDVLVLYGNQTPRDIIRDVIDSGLDTYSIVLVDYAISLADRRTLAELYHAQQSTMPCFLVVDQVLLLYLALHEQSERLSVMLKCTLPFTSYQPFVRDGGAVADEMFCGREAEIHSICDPGGSGLVYGGRQLGKTALLQRAQSLSNKPEKKEYALYVSILQCESEESLASKLSAALQRAKIGVGIHTSLVELCDGIRDLLTDPEGRVIRILLLMDEADRYLASISGNGYLALQPLVDLRRETGNRFKFVLAGLHNVARAKNASANNSIIGQLGTPLCVKPLSPADALVLISRPLSYLGFDVNRYPHLETILTSTNYYPGILQFFGYILVETMTSQYATYYRAQDGNPPYPLSEQQLGAIMSSNDLNNSIKEKFRLSLQLDPRYLMIARCIGLLYYEAEEVGDEGELEGYSPLDIKKEADSWQISALANESLESYGNLLDEMVDMFILSKPDSDVQRYRLRRHAFLNIIGRNEDAILEDIEADNEKERHSHE